MNYRTIFLVFDIVTVKEHSKNAQSCKAEANMATV